MSNDKLISGPAALVVLMCFFLPWFSVSCGNVAEFEFTGYDLTMTTIAEEIGDELNMADLQNPALVEQDMLLLIVPVAALAALFLVVAANQGSISSKASGQGQIVAALAGLGMLFYKWNQVNSEISSDATGLLQYDVEIGLMGSIAGLVLIVLGAVWAMNQTDVGNVAMAGSPTMGLMVESPPAVPDNVGPMNVPQMDGPPDAQHGVNFAGFDAPPAMDPTQVGFSPQAAGSPAMGSPIAPPPSPKTEVIRVAPKKMAWLVVKEGTRAGHQFPLSENTSIGRNAENEIILDDSALSGIHARVKLEEDEKFFFYDMASTNGVFYFNPENKDWERIYRHELKDGDQIKLGRTVLHFMSLTTGSAT